MEAVIESKKTLAQLVEPVTIYPQLMKNVYVRDKKEAQNDVEVQKVIKEVKIPSPVVACLEKMICPDCSPPIQ